MKIRNGFVSNSSSSSFLIVGTNFNREKMKALAQADQPDMNGFGGEYEGKTFVFLGGEFEYDSDTNEEMVATYEPYYVGLPAEKALKEGRTVQELREEFIEKAKALGVTFAEKEVDLHYGEVSSE